MKPYADFGKVSKKLLNDDFVSGKKVEVKTATDNGVSFTATGLESSNDGSLSGMLSWKYRVYGNSFTTKVLTSNTISTEAIFDKLGVNGLKATVNGAIGAGKQSATTKVEYSIDPVAAAALVDIVDKTVVPSIAIGYKNIGIGADAVISNDSKDVSRYSVGATVVHKDSEISLTAYDQLKTFKIAFSHVVSTGFSIAAEAKFNRDAQTMGMTTGIMYSAGGNVMRLKSDSDGTLSLAYAAKVDKATTLTLSTSTNMKEIEKGQKVGLALTLDQPYGSRATTPSF
eukprot:Plantae.Rhodophyta-Purpureofilum_apyrenoidigerum.ctg6013.p1 GENE.Plantae.Rhodophyta-Purpureofilum_apyrenoidigerum.ctg6013~~Plantae.Rhodophyta-Purpureofilum_apyrenoidigerum.ctg6013.p1  ORF type:complete len:284 (+),score=63.38 Plantae.Rhodophyta-Purpureofilum_apyrenoidigerum.ctg6013:93-944(+)